MKSKWIRPTLLLVLLLALLLILIPEATSVQNVVATDNYKPLLETYAGQLIVPFLASECPNRIVVTQGYNGPTHNGQGDKYAFDMQCIGTPSNSSFTLGKTVVAAAEGWAYVIVGHDGGTVVLIDHGGNYYTQYVHVIADSSLPTYDINFQIPDSQVTRVWVSQGDAIATVGEWQYGNHLHFEVAKWLGSYRNIPNHFATSQYWGDVALGHMGSRYYPETEQENAHVGEVIDGFSGNPNNQPPGIPPLESPADEYWLGSRTVTLEWLDGGDPDNQPNNFRDYNAVVWNNSGWRAEQGWPVGVFYTDTSWQLTVPRDGTYYWHVRAGDGDLPSDWSDTWSFHVDASPPNPPSISVGGSGCGGIPNNGWQNTCNDPAFTWSATDVGGSDIEAYYYCWSTNSDCNPTTRTTSTSFAPAAIAPVDGTATYYLNVRARDKMNHDSSLASFGVRYDGTRPTVSIQINGGAETTNQTNVLLNLSASDTGSGVAGVRISNNNLIWSDWQPYAEVIPWTLPALDRRTHAVYVQVRDHAGNESTIASDGIDLDLYPPMPHSTNYRICQDVIDVGGSAGTASASYSLVSTIGQPWATGATANTSSGFSERAGFLSSITGCLPISHTVTSFYTVTNWVVASGGNLRGSNSYRLGDTAGQPAASGATTFTSANYRLSSGFWAQITGTVPPTPTVTPPTPTLTPTVTPTPTPTPTPQPGGFGVSINEGGLYTNDPNVAVRVWAPNVTHMRLSNDGGYSDEGWQTYQVTTTWTISTYGEYVMPRYVYAWFRDAWSGVYGSYFDDIIYDPVAPEGQISILGGETSTVTLWLEAWDDNSGVVEVRVGESPTLEGASWQPYTSTLEWTLTGDVVYAQFRDNAGNPSIIYSSDGSHIYTEKIYLPLVLRNH